MNKLWRRTQSHKSNNTAGKHYSRLRNGNGLLLLIVVIVLLLCFSATAAASYSTPHFEYEEEKK